MVQVNAAWEILSDPESRRRHDLERQHPNDQAIQVAARADATRARQTAEQYPKTWSEVESWLDHLAADFTEAKYDLTGEYPGVTNSVSGVVFVAIGTILGGAIGIALPFLEAPGSAPPRTLEDQFKQAMFGLWVITPIGAFLGARIHKWISTRFLKPRNQSTTTTSKQRRSQNNPSPSATRTNPTMQIVACKKCGQKLRVPEITSELVLTCGRCRHRFSHSQ